MIIGFNAGFSILIEPFTLILTITILFSTTSSGLTLLGMVAYIDYGYKVDRPPRKKD